MKKSFFLKWSFIFLGGFIVFIISFTIIYEILIPDICYYHINEMNPIMNIFYSAGGGDNGHPSPNILNFILSFYIGAILGNWIYKIISAKKHA